jgi:hypothetical protein
MEKQDARKYLAANGFKVSSRGSFSKEMIQALRDSKLEFTQPILDPKPQTKVGPVPLV